MKKKFIMFLLMLLLIPCVSYALTTDNTPPVLKSIKVKGTNFDVDDKIYLDLDVSDDVCGVRSGSFDIFKSDDFMNSIPIEIKDINSNPYFVLPKNIKSGTYEMFTIAIDDACGNIALYSDKSKLPKDTSSTAEDYEQISLDFKFDVTNKNVVDSNDYPVLKNISFEKSTVEIGKKNKVIATVDSKDAIDEIEVTICEEGSSGVNKSQDLKLKYNSKTGKYEATFDVEKVNGTYEIYYVKLLNVNGNHSGYGFKPDDPSSGIIHYHDNLHTYYYGSKVTFEVTGGSTDSKAPILKNVKFNKTKSDAPSRVMAILDIEDESNLKIGIIYLCIKDSKANKGESLISGAIEKDEESGQYISYINIDQFVEKGFYHIAYVILEDEYGNKITYSVDAKHDYGNKFDKDQELEIIDNINANYTTSTISKDMLKVIKEAEDDSIIMIDGTKNTLIPKEVFEAIQDTNKTIYIEYFGIQWVFNGKDIKEPKDVDAVFNTEEYYGEDGEYLGTTLIFGENGVLPGKAKVRVKSEYTYQYEFGKEDLYVYYYDAEDNTYYCIADQITLSEDGYYEFNLLHNSSYTLTSIKNDNSKKDEIYEINAQENENKVIKKDKTKEQSKGKKKVNLLIFVLPIVIIVTGCVIFIIIKKKKLFKKNKTNEKDVVVEKTTEMVEENVITLENDTEKDLVEENNVEKENKE